MSSPSFEERCASLDQGRLSRRDVLRLGAAGAASAAGVSLLAACGGATTTTTPSGGPTTISWQAIPSYSLQATDPNRALYIQNAVNAWEQRNKGSTITPVVASADETAANARLALQLGQGRAPDVVMVDSYIFPNAQFRPFAQPIDAYLPNIGVSFTDFFPFCQKAIKNSAGQVVGLWFTTDVRVLFYRKDLVPTPPASWNDVLTIGKSLAQQGYWAYTFPAGRGESTSTTGLLPYYWTQGVDLYDASGTLLLKSDPGKTAMLKAFQFIQTLVQQGITPQSVTQYKAEADQNGDMASGKIAMCVGGNFQVPQLAQIIGSQKFYSQWGIAPIPSSDGTSHATTAGGWIWAVFTKDKTKQKAAVDFVGNAFVNDQGMAGWDNVGGYLPTRTRVYTLPSFTLNPFTSTFQQHLHQYAHVRPAVQGYQDLSTQLQVAVGNIVSGSQTPSDALNMVLQQVS